MSLTVASKLRYGFMFAFAVLLLAGLLTLYSTKNWMRASDAVQHSSDVLESLEAVRALTAEAEGGVRGFLLTGNDEFLKPFQEAHNGLPRALNRLRLLTVDNLAQQRRLDEIEPLISERLALAEDDISVRRTRGLQAAAELVATGRSKILAERARDLLASMESEEDQLLVARTVADRRSARFITIAQLTVLGLALSLLVIALILLNRLITQPVARLTEGVERLAAGDLNARVASTGGDELGLLARSFNQMAQTRQQTELALSRAKGLLDALFCASPLAIVGLDTSGNVDTWNPAAERVFGYRAETVLGQPPTVIPETQTADFAELRRRVLEGCEVIRVERQRQRSDGTTFDARIFFAPRIGTRGVLGMMALVEDITDEKKAADALRESERRLAHELEVMARLQRIAADFVRAGDLHAALGEVLETTIATTHADMGTVRLLDCASGRLGIVTSRGLPLAWLGHFDSVDPNTPTAAVTALRQGERVIIENIAGSEVVRSARDRELHAEAGVRAIQSTPLVGSSGHLVGTLSTYYRAPTRPSARDLAMLDLLASQVAEMVVRAEAEEGLRQSEAGLKRAQEIAHFGSWERDVARNRVRWSDEMFRIFGIDPITFGGTFEAFLEMVHPDDRAAFNEARIRAIHEHRDEIDAEYRIVRPSTGDVRAVHARIAHTRDASGNIVRSTGTVHDITERKNIEHSLRESEERFRLIIDEAPIGMALMAPDGRFVRVNHALCEIVGYSPDELTKLTFQEITHPEDLGSDLRLAAQLVRGEIARYQLDKRYFRKDGRAVNVMLSVSALRGSDGRPVYFISQIEDITRRKQFDEALRQSEAEFRVLIELAPDAVFVANLDGRFIDVNTRACDMMGYTREELLDRLVTDILAPADLPRLARTKETLHTPGAVQVAEWTHVRKDGAPIAIEVSSAIMPDGRWVAFARDIQQRKAAEEALRFSEAKFSGIISIAEDAIIALDEAQNITVFNQGAERTFGYSAEEVLGKPHALLLPERFRQVHGRHIAGFAGGDIGTRRMGQRTTQIAGRRKNGEEFPAEASISRLDVGGQRLLNVVLRDVTEARRAAFEQQFLAEAGAILTSSLNDADTLKRLAQEVVREAADLCAIDAVNEQGQLHRLVVVAADPAMAEACERFTRLGSLCFVDSAVTSGEPQVWPEVTTELLRTFATSTKWIELVRELEVRSAMAAPLMAHGKLEGAVLFCSRHPRRYSSRDLVLLGELASRMGLTVENARLYQNARRATRARDEVLGIVAHDLRNPLSAIMMAATVLEHQLAGAGAPRGLKSVETIARSVRRGQRLIEDLLDLTKVEAGQLAVRRERVRSRQFIYDTIDGQQLLASSASIELRIDIDEHLPDLWGDHDRLLQVMENLISNAVRFTPAGGSITIGAELRGDEVVFRVADTGSGIAAEDLVHLFERFWRARRDERSGAGLGLPICKGIVEAHGGHIWAESAGGKGTTFYFTVPAWHGPRDEVHEASAAHQ